MAVRKYFSGVSWLNVTLVSAFGRLVTDTTWTDKPGCRHLDRAARLVGRSHCAAQEPVNPLDLHSASRTVSFGLPSAPKGSIHFCGTPWSACESGIPRCRRCN